MVTWKLKSCTRCGGDVYLDKDYDGWYEQCLQCCFRRPVKPVAENQVRPKLPGRTEPDLRMGRNV